MRRIAVVGGIVMSLWWAPQAEGQSQPLEVAARHRQLFGGSRGTLVFSDEGIAFRGSRDQSYRWSYAELREVRVASPTRVSFVIEVDPGSIPPPHGKSIQVSSAARADYTFETLDPIPAAAVERLLAHVARPVVTTVMPPLPAAPIFRAGVSRDGRQGELLLYDGGLAYVSANARDRRYWRFRDLFSVLQLDRYRFEITAYEGSGRRMRTFTLELTIDLPPGMYDAIWHRVNALKQTPLPVTTATAEQTHGMTAMNNPKGAVK